MTLNIKRAISPLWVKAALVGAICFPIGVLAQTQTETIISQKGRAYAPGQVEIKAGDALTIVNDDIFLHHAFIDSADMTFDSGSMDEGDKTRIQFDTPGTYAIKCAIHPKMNLDVTVR